MRLRGIVNMRRQKGTRMSLVKAQYDHVLQMFSRVASDYNKVNRAMTLGRHAKWCAEIADLAAPHYNGRLLDIATGTGPIAFAVQKQYPNVNITACDFSESMISIASNRRGAENITWEIADANSLKFKDESFDAVTHGYLLRNVEDVRRVLREQYRVLKRGGRLVILETCPPKGILKFPVSLGIKIIVPMLGLVLARNRAAYRYLAQSTLDFMTPAAVVEVLMRIGFTGISCQRRFFSTHMLLVAEKPEKVT